MRLFEPFLHFFTPRHTNNHRAKALQVSSITTYIVLLLAVQIFLTGFAKFNPGILGYASNITVADLLRYTNEKRAAANEPTLQLNDQLSQAAQAKAADMFANQYWAHNSPSGRDPWAFISDAGYTYLFAGENLARDFGDSRGVVNAWMNSPSHKENLLNSRYQDVGFAVANGKYNDYETTLVVQMFGAKSVATPTVEAPQKAVPAAAPAPVEQTLPLENVQSLTSSAPTLPVASQVKIDIFSWTKNISVALVAILLGVLVIDSALAYRRKVVRLSGHNFAHLVFLLAVLVVLNVIGRGLIL